MSLDSYATPAGRFLAGAAGWLGNRLLQSGAEVIQRRAEAQAHADRARGQRRIDGARQDVAVQGQLQRSAGDLKRERAGAAGDRRAKIKQREGAADVLPDRRLE